MIKNISKLQTNELYNVLSNWSKKKDIVILYRNGVIPVHIIDYLTYYEYWNTIKSEKYAVENTSVEFNVTRKTIYKALKTFLIIPKE